LIDGWKDEGQALGSNKSRKWRDREIENRKKMIGFLIYLLRSGSCYPWLHNHSQCLHFLSSLRQ